MKKLFRKLSAFTYYIRDFKRFGDYTIYSHVSLIE